MKTGKRQLLSWLMPFLSTAMNIQNSHLFSLHSGSRTGSHMAEDWLNSAREALLIASTKHKLYLLLSACQVYHIPYQHHCLFLSHHQVTHIDGTSVLVPTRLERSIIEIFLFVPLIIPAHQISPGQSTNLHITDLNFHLYSISPCFQECSANGKPDKNTHLILNWSHTFREKHTHRS